VKGDDTVRRVLVGCFFIECNSFAQGTTTREDFEATGLSFGSTDAVAQVGEYSAALAVLSAAGIEAVPSVYAWSSPRPPVSDAFLLELFDGFVAVAREHADTLDGVYLQLHGGAMGQEIIDPEGLLLTHLRRVLPSLPFAASFDHHAYMSDEMLAALDIVTAYRTSPHVDTERTGAQAARLLVAALDGDIDPILRSIRIPMVTPADQLDSALPEFASIMDYLDDVERLPDILAAAAFPMTPWLDVADLGWRAVVTSDRNCESPDQVLRGIAERMWLNRRHFVEGPRRSAVDSLERARGADRLVVIADAGDATNGGAPGDSTEVLRCALVPPDIRVWIPVVDATVVRSMLNLNLGDRVHFTVCDGRPGDYNESVDVSGILVLKSPDAVIGLSHPMLNGIKASVGALAVVRVGEIRLIIHERAVSVVDPSIFRAAGCRLERSDVLIVKSHVTFRSGFLGIDAELLVADTSGPTSMTLQALPYSNRPTPLFPFEDTELDIEDLIIAEAAG